MKLPRLRLLTAVLAVGAANVGAENWPGFRGPTHQGTSTESGLPVSWSATSNVVWKTPIPGEAWSSPIVWGDRVFVTTATDDGAGCHVLGLERSSGTILFDTEVLRQPTGHRNNRNSYATPTPCTDGERIYAVFGDGSFVAVNFDGRVQWTNRDFPFYSEHGLATSPLLWNGLLIMARDGSSETEPKAAGWQTPWDKSYVMALDARSGQLRWKTGRVASRIAHVCPNVWTAPDGRVEVISGAGDVVQSFDALTGKLLWTSKNVGEGVVPSIVLGDGLAFTASGWGGRESIKAFKLGAGTGDLGDSNLAWEQRKGMPRIPSFLYLKPHLFSITEGGVALCLKADTGEIVWQDRVGGNHSASPVCADGKIYFLADDGLTTVIDAGPRFTILARNPLGEKAQASIAISGGHLFIRTASNLYCIGHR